MFKWLKNKPKRQVPEVDRYFDLAEKRLNWLQRANTHQLNTILCEIDYDDLLIIVSICEVSSRIYNTLVMYLEALRPRLDEPFPTEDNN
jgi:hypothetical protein